MNFVIVTGYSGAGKTKAISVFEDMGYYCIDNIPPALIKSFAMLLKESGNFEKVAIVTDTRGKEFFSGLLSGLHELQAAGVNYRVLFLEANDDVIANRYKETRKKHPLYDEAGGSTRKAVEYEKELLAPIREHADYVIDTSLTTPAELKERIIKNFADNPENSFTIQCMSFGFKYGPAIEADLMFDVRCLPNPFYVDKLRQKTGLDKNVRDYVLANQVAVDTLQKITDLLDFLIPLYQKEGKTQLVIAFGCTGGKHRSVTFAEQLYHHFYEQGKRVTVVHRDIKRHTLSNGV